MKNDKKEIEQESTAPPQTSSIPIIDLVLGILDRIFKDNATGKVMASRVAVIIILFSMMLIWFKGEEYMQLYKESRYESYSKILQKNRDQAFDTAALEQLQIVHVSSNADFSAVYSFRPKNLNYFVDLVAYEGKLPDIVDEKNLGGFPVDKTSQEYQTHLTGAHFQSFDEFVFLPTKQHNSGLKYMYSCPYFNMDNIYSGTVSMYWYNNPVLDEKRLSQICAQAARTLGRTR